ncbi:MAG: PKD domain-containing protein [Candidatus Thermoplasmatota archaeon]|nr:PKD domain-containing protein [Candidatus Thermoplasmatota archaeon]
MRGGKSVGLMMATLMIFTALAGCLDILGSNSPPSANMSIDPPGSVKAGEAVTFSAVGSSDPDADPMTFEWTFGDGNTGNGLTTSHTYAQPGEYTAKLAVSDGTHEVTTSMSVTVIDSSAREPHAEIVAEKDNDCEGESPPSGDFVLVWVCEDDREIDDRDITVSTTVSLDGTASWAGCDPEDPECYAEEYIVSYEWDLDRNSDSDGDGITDNDVDATGDVVNWEERPAGAWDIRLTVTDNNGLTDHDDSVVYVNYRGKWADFEMDRRIQEPITMTWNFPVTYDDESKDRIRYLRLKVDYPKEDDDQIGGGIGGTTTNNKLDIYLYNSTDEEISNTTGIGNDNRNAGDCGNNDYCVWMVVGGSTVRGFLPGDWTADLMNEETHTTKVNYFIVELQYR